MRVYILVNVVIVDSTQINLVIRVYHFSRNDYNDCMLSHYTPFSFCIDKLILYSF